MSNSFKVVVKRNGHKAAACLYVQFWLLGEPPDPRENPVPGLSEWNVPEKPLKACGPFLLPSLPLIPGQIPILATPLWGGCFHP